MKNFKTVLFGENIILKKLELKYAQEIYKLRQDTDVTKFLPNKYHNGKKKTEDYIKNNIEKWKKKKTLNYVILLSNRAAGMIMLSKLDFKNLNCELGVWLGKEFWHKKIANEAAHLLLKYAFNELNMERVYFLINQNNIASIKFFEKIGAKKEGLLRRAGYIDGKFEDKFVYSILKEEFR